MDQPSSANTFGSMQPLEKVVYPSKSKRKKRFAKIREVIKGKR